MKASYYHTITLMAKYIDQANIPYQYTGRSALLYKEWISMNIRKSTWMYNGMSLMRLLIFFRIRANKA
ncbi:hypothetical protein KEH51_07410 [[Brevibacterium] frigoritolerans]|uniref:Uncharacterized protein n=1 Tax=Peribacillus frigoritolerans TaxID=450367 RepID=A0A941FQU6_9BACI|nr:hypothetical protein [Peribacillus frigoritolerans]